MTSPTTRRRLARYKRRKDNAKTSTQFITWSVRYHNLCFRLHGPPDLWNPDTPLPSFWRSLKR